MLAADARVSQFLDPQSVRRMYESHRDGHSDEGFRLWSILTLERWLRRTMAAQPVPATPVPEPIV